MLKCIQISSEPPFGFQGNKFCSGERAGLCHGMGGGFTETLVIKTGFYLRRMDMVGDCLLSDFIPNLTHGEKMIVKEPC